MAASMGGNVRVGLEDSLWIAKPANSPSPTPQQVRKVREILEGLGLAKQPHRPRRARSWC